MVVTNALGAVFTAMLVSANEQGATFVFPEDGATGTLAWAAIAPCSRETVRAEAKEAVIPPVLVPAWQMAERELRRMRALVATGRLTAGAAATRTRALRALWAERCRDAGISAAEQARLLARFDREERATR